MHALFSICKYIRWGVRIRQKMPLALGRKNRSEATTIEERLFLPKVGRLGVDGGWKKNSTNGGVVGGIRHSMRVKF